MHKVVQMHHFLILEHFHHPRKKPGTESLHFPLSHKPLETTNLLSVAMGLPILGMSDKRNPTKCSLWYLASFTRHNVFRTCPCCIAYANFIPFYNEIHSIVGIHRILLIHLSVDGQWACLHFFAVTGNAAMNMRVQVFV